MPMHIREVYPNFGNVFAVDAAGRRWLLWWQDRGVGIEDLAEGQEVQAECGIRGVAYLKPRQP